MRKLLIIILLLGSLPAFAQTIGPGWKPQNFKANNRDSAYYHKDVNFNSTVRVKENALRIGLVTVTANGTELNLLDGALVNTNELNNLVGVTGKTGTGNIVLSASPTFSGTVALGSGSLTMTGSLAATGSRVLKGWFTDMEITNLPTINGGTFKTALAIGQNDVAALPDTLLTRYTKAQADALVRKEIMDSIKAALEIAPIALSRPDSGLVTSGGYTTGFDWKNGIEENIIKAAKTVTTISPVLARPIVCIGGMLTGQTTLTDGRAQYVTFYIPEPTTITGVRFVLQTQGDYTADNYNGAKLYKVTSASTFARLDSTANNGNFWKGSVVTKNDFAFTGGARLLEPGLYVVGFIWNASATTAAPVMYTSFNNSSATNVMYFGNGGVNQTKLAGYLSTQTDLAVNEAFNDLSSDTVAWGIFLY